MVGCYSMKKDGKSTSFYHFPLDNQELLDRWLKAIPRKNFQPTKHSLICSINFCQEDIMIIREDSSPRRHKSELLMRPRLRTDAIPMIFPGLPKYLSAKPNIKRTGNASTASRFQNMEARLIENIQAFFNADKVHCLGDI